MYGLPVTTAINKQLYKKAVFEKFNLKAARKRVKSEAHIGSSEREQSRPEVKAAERERFDADISKMALVARISPATVPALSEGKEIKGFYVLQVILKRKDFSVQNILFLQKLIPQKLIFALQFEELTQFCIFHTRLQQSVWMATEEAVITLQGLSLDDVWNNIVATIGGLDAQAEESIEEQIIHREQREKLLRQIESLEKQCRTEKQTHKKYELHQKLIKLKEELK